MRAFAALLLLCAAAAEAKPKAAKSPHVDPRLIGIGRSCRKTKDCIGKGQRCIPRTDANGRPLDVGLCVVPCASYSSGQTKIVPAPPDPKDKKKKKKAQKQYPSRCPPGFSCRTKGGGIPIDICLRS